MSMEAIRWAWAQDVPKHLKCTLVALADHADKSGNAYPSQELLAWKLGVKVRGLRKDLAALQALGLIETRLRTYGSAGRISSEYRLALEKPGREPFRGATGNASGAPTTGTVVPVVDEDPDPSRGTVVPVVEDVHDPSRGTVGPSRGTVGPSRGTVVPPNPITQEPSKTPKPPKGDRVAEVSSGGNGATPPCPHGDIIALYHETIPELPQILISRWDGSKAYRDLSARWREDERHRSMEFWRWFFETVRKRPHWMGENERAWKANLRWLVNRANFDKVVELGVNLDEGRR